MAGLTLGHAPVGHLRNNDGAVNEHAHGHDQGEQHHHVYRYTEGTDDQNSHKEAAGNRNADQQCRAHSQDADDDDEHQQHCRNYAVLQFRQLLLYFVGLVARFEDTDVVRPEALFFLDCRHHIIDRADNVGAFIAEPIQGAGGVVIPPSTYWPEIQRICDAYGILLIADEVVTGFGRLGSMFGADHYGIEADLITIAKGLTSAYAPLSGSIISDKMWEVLERGTDENGPIGHGWTYSAHPIGAAAGVALGATRAGWGAGVSTRNLAT